MNRRVIRQSEGILNHYLFKHRMSANNSRDNISLSSASGMAMRAIEAITMGVGVKPTRARAPSTIPISQWRANCATTARYHLIVTNLNSMFLLCYD